MADDPKEQAGRSDDAEPRALPDESTIERRVVVSPVEQLRALPDSPEPSRMIGGYAAVFDRQSRLINDMFGGPYTEQVTRGFFEQARALGWPGNQGSGVLCRYNHNDQYLLGTVRAGTCELSVDRTGLQYRTNVPKCRDDVLELVTRGDIAQSSFTMMDCEDDWSYRGGITHRTLISGQVLDVAPVSAVPAYQDTTVGLRSLARRMDADPDDVFAMAREHELRRLWVRTDQTMLPANGEQRSVDTIEGAQKLADELHRSEITATEPAAEPAAEPQQLELADEPSETPPLADESPATLSWQEAHLRLYETRPFDPITSS